MTINRSLSISFQLQQLLRSDLLKHISQVFPYDLIAAKRPANSRDRVFNEENTIMTMLLTAASADKTLQHSVNIFKEVFDRQSLDFQMQHESDLAVARQQDTEKKKKAGRPRLYKSKLPISKTKSLSTNTAAYSKARKRIGLDLIQDIFTYSTDFSGLKEHTWHDMAVYIADGTYFQMQDSPELSAKYYVKQGDQSYPQGLLETIIRQGTGQIQCFKITTRHITELEPAAELSGSLESGSLLIADDLYNTYAMFALCNSRGHHLLVPGKRERNYRVIKTISPQDQIVELTKTPTPLWWKKEYGVLPDTIRVRRISWLSPYDGQSEYVLYTTLLDEKIPGTDFITKYLTRWDIEICIRETKTLMDINVVRAKTEQMMLKEITIALTTYNMIRKIIAQSVEQTDFSPQEDIIQKLFETDKSLLMDKKGRVYNRWSTGRHGSVVSKDQTPDSP